MRVGEAAVSFVVRVVLFYFVISSLTGTAHRDERRPTSENPIARSAAVGHVRAFSTASFGFAASVALIVAVLTMLGAHIQPPAPSTITIALRGSLH